MAKTDPIFTIVTPSYNQASFLEETILSVLTQKGDFTIQYIIADGGSSDGSVEIIKKYDELLKNGKLKLNCKGIILTWWSRKDKGQSDAINQGFKLAKGKYIAWLNSDDYYVQGALEGALKALGRNEKLGLVYGDYDMVDAEGNIVERKKAPRFDTARLIDEGNFIAQPSCFVTKRALDKVGLLNPKYHYALDYDLWVRIWRQFPTKKVDELWSKFRLHPNSKTVSLEKNFWKEEREISRENGAPFISQHLINHYHKTSPLMAFLLIKLRNAGRMIRRGEISLVFKRLFQNLSIMIRKK
jgi:glycosyltransferase involved in cell wall biosynthesis